MFDVLLRTSLITLVCALVISKVNYLLNQRLMSVIRGRLPSVLHATTQIIISARRSERINPLLRELHWLCVLEGIKFRLCVPTYQRLHDTCSSAPCRQSTADGSDRRYHDPHRHTGHITESPLYTLETDSFFLQLQSTLQFQSSFPGSSRPWSDHQLPSSDRWVHPH